MTTDATFTMSNTTTPDNTSHPENAMATLQNLSMNPATIHETNWIYLLLSLVIVAALATNGVIVAAVVRQNRLHKTIYYLVMSLSVCNLLNSVLVMPFSLVRVITGRLLYPQAWCRVLHAVSCVLSASTVVHLCLGISDCHISLLNPIKYHLRDVRTYNVLNVVLAWAFSAMLATPAIILAEFSDHLYNGNCIAFGNSTLILLRSVLCFILPSLLLFCLAFWAGVDHSRRLRLADKMNSDSSSYSTSLGDVSGYERLDAMSLALGNLQNGDNGEHLATIGDLGGLLPIPGSHQQGLNNNEQADSGSSDAASELSTQNGSPGNDSEANEQDGRNVESEDSDQASATHACIEDIPDLVKKTYRVEVGSSSVSTNSNVSTMPDFVADTLNHKSDGESSSSSSSSADLRTTSPNLSESPPESISKDLESTGELFSHEDSMSVEAKVHTQTSVFSKNPTRKSKTILNLPLTMGTVSVVVPESVQDGYDNQAYENTSLADTIQVTPRKLSRHSTWQKSRSMDSNDEEARARVSAKLARPVRRASSLGEQHSGGSKGRTRSILRRDHRNRSTVRKNVKFASTIAHSSLSRGNSVPRKSKGLRRKKTPHPRKVGKKFTESVPSANASDPKNGSDAAPANGNGAKLERCNSIQSMSSIGSLLSSGVSPLTAYLAWVHREHSKRMVQRIHKQHNILKMLCLMYMTYVVFSLPYWALHIVCGFTHNAVCHGSNMAHGTLPVIFEWLAWSTCFLIPCVVLARSKEVRTGVIKLK